MGMRQTVGTEPKVKFYLGVKGTSLADADAKSKRSQSGSRIDRHHDVNASQT